MKHLQNLRALAAAGGLLILIFDSRIVVDGAKSGIELCVKTVIPSLFPFLILTAVITRSINTTQIAGLSQVIKALGIPAGASGILIPAFLGGYPIGAKSAGELFRRNQISKDDAERLLAFCSNAGPSFLFGMVAMFFSDTKTVFGLWLIHVTGAVLTSLSFPAGTTKYVSPNTIHTETSEADVMLSSSKAMAVICGWVILFRIIVSFLQAWFLWCFPDWLQVLVIGICELSNGCSELLLIQDEKIRFIICSCMLAFGGICVFLQTVSVTSGLSLRYYIRGKLLQTLFCFLLSCAAVTKQRLLFLSVIPLLLAISRKLKNRGSIPVSFPV